MPALLLSDEFKRLEDDLGPITWAFWYDYPYATCVFVMLFLLGSLDELIQALAIENPTAELVQSLKAAVDKQGIDIPAEIEGDEWDALRYSLLAVAYFNQEAIMYYSMPLNSLIEKGRNGDDEAFYQAISIDPCVAGTDAFLSRLATAKVCGPHGFLKHSGLAMRGPKDKLKKYRNLRWTDYFLRDLGSESTATIEQHFDLVSGVLKQYEASGADPVKAFAALRSDWRKKATS